MTRRKELIFKEFAATPKEVRQIIPDYVTEGP